MGTALLYIRCWVGHEESCIQFFKLKTKTQVFMNFLLQNSLCIFTIFPNFDKIRISNTYKKNCANVLLIVLYRYKNNYCGILY